MTIENAVRWNNYKVVLDNQKDKTDILMTYLMKETEGVELSVLTEHNADEASKGANPTEK